MSRGGGGWGGGGGGAFPLGVSLYFLYAYKSKTTFLDLKQYNYDQ